MRPEVYRPQGKSNTATAVLIKVERKFVLQHLSICWLQAGHMGAYGCDVNIVLH